MSKRYICKKKTVKFIDVSKMSLKEAISTVENMSNQYFGRVWPKKDKKVKVKFNWHIKM